MPCSTSHSIAEDAVEKESAVRLRAFDLRGKHGLLAYVCPKKKRLVWQKRRDAVEPPERECCRFKRLLKRAVQNEGRIRR